MKQAVILAAGKGTRCYPLTLTRPKVLLKVANKTLLEHNLEQLEGLVTEAIIVIGYMGEKVKEVIGVRFGKLMITYVEQKEVNGTGGALLACERLLDDRFLVLNGDDLYSREDIKRCISHDFCVVGKTVDNPENFGVLQLKGKYVTGFEEKPKNPSSSIIGVGLYVFDLSIFEHKLKKTIRGEYEIIDYVTYLVKKGKKVFCENVQDYWLPVGYPWHILDANEFLLKRMKPIIASDAVIEKGATLKGNVSVGHRTVIKAGAYIEGPAMIGDDCTIGPNCFIRGCTTLGNGCRVNNGTEVKNSVFFNQSYASHLSYVCDSVLGEHVNIGAGTIVANLRHDGAVVASMVDGVLVPTGRRKFGAVCGDHAKTGIHTSIYPGRKLWPYATTLPGEIVTKDKMTEKSETP